MRAHAAGPGPEPPAEGGAEAIPVRNVYYLLCYAWDQWAGGPPVEVRTVEGASVLDLLALVLARGASRLLRQGLRREYWRREEEIAGLRGKLVLAPSVSRGLLLEVCRLIRANLLVGRGGRASTFRDLRRDELRMWRIFEGFLRRFLEREQERYAVAAPAIRWHGAGGTPGDRKRLPGMQTDIVLSAPHRKVVVDAKFYKDAFSGRFGRKGVRSGHLYQILAYLQNLAAAEGEAAAEAGRSARPVDGVLVYPVVRERFDLRYELLGHRVRVCSVDLGQGWRGVHDEVLGVVEWG